MGFFYKHKPKGYNYIPRYYNPEKEAWEQKKAEAGLSSNLSHEEQLRLEMRRKWGVAKEKEDPSERRVKMLRSFVIVAVVAIEEPQIAPKPAQPITVAIAAPFIPRFR